MSVGVALRALMGAAGNSGIDAFLDEVEVVQLAAPAAAITFSGLDGRPFYEVALAVIHGDGGDVNVSLNGDTTNSNYSRQTLRGTGTTLDSSRNTGSSIVARRITTDTGLGSGSLGTLHITIAKPLASAAALILTSNTEVNTVIVTGANALRWGNTDSLLSSIGIIPSSGTWSTGSIAWLNADMSEAVAP